MSCPELWRPIPFPDYPQLAGLYEASVTGLIKNARTGYIMKPKTDKYGYHEISIRKRGDDICISRKVHRLILSAFVPQPAGKDQVDHRDGVRNNNHLSNLRWATSTENNRNRRDNSIYGSNLTRQTIKKYEYWRISFLNRGYQKNIRVDVMPWKRARALRNWVALALECGIS